MHNHSHASHTHNSHGHASRRDFFQQLIGGAMAGASVLEMGFFRAAVARAQAPGASTQLFDIQKIADGVYFALAHPQAFTNCNASIFVNSQDVLVVDAHSKPSAAASLIAQIKKEVTTKPVRYLVNTHFHWDHSQGDAAYRATGSKVEIIASETTKQLLAQNARNRLKESLDGVPKIIEGLQARLSKAASAQEKDFFKEQIRLAQAYQAEMKSFTPELPDIAFAKSHVIKDRAHDLHIEFHGRAHTAGDVAVFCPQKRAVATGDAIIGFLPNIADGYPREWPATINSIEQLAADHLLPGHGVVQNKYDRANQLRNYIEELTAMVETGKKAGKPLAELQKSITPASLKTLQANGYGSYVTDNMQKFSV
jgi:glyoxylase-like metal-dependent hydrolase (beta-lactamase superfamily II)